MGSEMPGEGIEVRKCHRCGEEFYGLTGQSAQEKLSEHEPRCVPETSDQHNDAKYSTSIRPPRDVTQYEMSPHFHSMKTRRENPKITSDIIESTVNKGLIKNTGEADRFIFEWDSGDHLWWVIVEMRDQALRQNSEKHVALTVFARDSPDHEVVEKYI
jgi:hypothetical protein